MDLLKYSYHESNLDVFAKKDPGMGIGKNGDIMEKQNLSGEIEAMKTAWEDELFQSEQAAAREIVVRLLRELNGFYIVKTGHGFLRFVESRMKTPESICGKLERKGYAVNFDTALEKLNDLSGVRCICYSVKEIYWVARQIGNDSRFTVVKAKDYIRKPKKNGYESYHIVMDVPVPAQMIEEKISGSALGQVSGRNTEKLSQKPSDKTAGKNGKHKNKGRLPQEDKKIRVELQLRTMIMDAWAGMDNRISYKRESEISPEMTKRIEKYAKIGRRLDKLIQRTLEEEVHGA